MAHEITELKDTVLRNPRYREIGAKEFQFDRRSSTGDILTLGNGPDPDPESGS